MFSSALISVSGTDGYGYVPTVLPVPANPVPENTVSDALLFLTDDTTSYLTRSVSLVRKVASRMGTMIVSTEFTHGPRKEIIVVSYFADHLPLLFANGVAVEEKDHVVPLTVAYSVERLLLSLIRLEIVPPNVYRRVMEADTDDSAQKEIDDLVRSSEFWKIVNFVVSLKVNDKFHPLFTNMDVFVDAGRISSQIRHLRIEYWKEVRNYAISTWKTVPESVQPAGSKINEQAICSIIDSLLDDVVTAERMELEQKEWIPVSSQLGSFPMKGCTFEPEVKLSKKQRRRANAKLNKVEIGSQKQKMKASEAWAIQEVCGIDVTEVALRGVPVEKEGVAVQSVQSPPKDDPLVSNVEKEGRMESTMEKGPEPVGFSFSANGSSTSSVCAPRSTDFSFSAANSPCPSTSPLAAPRSTDFSFSANIPSTSSVAAPRSTEFSFSANNPSTSSVATPRSTVGLVFNKSALSFSAQRPSTSSIFGASKTTIQKGWENPTSATFTSFPIRKGLFTGISGNVIASTGVTTSSTESRSTTPVAPFAAYRGKSSFEPGASTSQLKPSSIFGTGVPNFRSFASAAGSITFFDLQQSDQKATSAGTEPSADACSEKTSEVDATPPAGSEGGIAPVLAVSPTISIDRDVLVAATSLNIPAECTASTGSEAAPAPNLRQTISITSSSVVAATTSESTSLSSPEKPSEASPTAAAETTLSSGSKDGPAPVPEVSPTVSTSTHIVEASTASESSTPCLVSIPSTSPDLPTKPRAPTVPAEVLPLSTEVLTVDVGRTTSTQPSEVERSPDTRSKQIWTPASEQSSSTTSTSHGKETAPLVTSLLPPPNRRSKTLFGVTLTSNEVPRVELKQIPDIWDSSIKEGWDTFKLLRVFLNKVFGRTGRFLIVTNQLDKCKDKSEGAMYLRLTLTGLEVWPGLYVCVEGSGCQLESAVLLAFLQLVMDVTGLSQLSPYVLDVLHNEKFNELVLNAVIMVLSGCAVHRGTFFVRHFDDVVYRYWPKANGVFRWKLLSLLTNAMRGTASLRGISREANLDLQVVCRTKGGLLGKMGMFERTSLLLISANSIRKISAGPVELSSIVSTSTHLVTAETTSQSPSSSNQAGPSTSVDLPAELRAPTVPDKVLPLATEVLLVGIQRQHDMQRQDLPTTSTLPSDVERSPDTTHEKCSSTTGTFHEQGTVVDTSHGKATVPLVTSLLRPPNRRSKTLFGVTLTSNEVPRVELKQIPDNWDCSIKEGSETYKLLREFLNKVIERTRISLIITNESDKFKDKLGGDVHLRLALNGLLIWPGLYVCIKGSGCQLESAVLLAFLQLLMDVTGMSQLSPYVEAVLHYQKLYDLVLNPVIAILSKVNRGRCSGKAFDEVVLRYWQKGNGVFRHRLQTLLGQAGKKSITLRGMSRESNSGLQKLCQTKGGLLDNMGMFEHTSGKMRMFAYASPPVISADSIKKISAGPLDWQEGDDSDVEVVEVPPKPAPEVIDLTDDDVLVVDSPSVVTIPEKNSGAQNVTENTPADHCIRSTSTSCEASSGGSSAMPGALADTLHRISPTVASSAIIVPPAGTVDPVQHARPQSNIAVAVNKSCRENGLADVPTSFSGRRQECGNRTAALVAAGAKENGPKAKSPVAFGVTLTSDRVPSVEMKQLADNWDFSLNKGYKSYKDLINFVNVCLARTNNTLIVTSKLSGFRDLVEGDCYLRLTLSRLPKWPGLFFNVEGDGCRLESKVLLAFVKFLLDVCGMSFLSPHAAALLYNESCCKLVLDAVCRILQQCSAHPQQGCGVLCRFDEIVWWYWNADNGLFRDSLQGVLAAGINWIWGLSPDENRQLQQKCAMNNGLVGEMKMFTYTSSAIISAKSFIKISGDPTELQAGDKNREGVVEAPAEPIHIHGVVDLTEESPVANPPIPKNTPPPPAPSQESSNCLPFGLVWPTSTAAARLSVTVTQFEDRSSAPKSQNSDRMSPPQRKRYEDLLRFMNEFLRKTGFSLTIDLRETPAENGSAEQADSWTIFVTVDQLPQFVVRSSGSRQFVVQAEMTIFSNFVGQLVSRMLLHTQGICLRRVISHPEATTALVDFIAAMFKSCPGMTKKQRSKGSPLVKKDKKELLKRISVYCHAHLKELGQKLETILPNDSTVSKNQKKKDKREVSRKDVRPAREATVSAVPPVPGVKADPAVNNIGAVPATPDAGLVQAIHAVLSSPTGSKEHDDRSDEPTEEERAGSRKRRCSPNRTHSPATKQRRSSPSLPFGLSTVFSSEQSIWHHLNQLPFTANEQKLLLADSRAIPAPVMRKQFMNRLLAKTEMNLILEQFSELSSSYCGFVIRLEHIPDSLFRVSYRVDSRTSSEQMEDEIMQTILGSLSGGLPALLPPASASAILHNQKSADYLATYVSGALKSVLARVKSLQGLILAGVLLTAAQMGDNLNGCLTEYWGNNKNALFTWLQSARNDFSRVPLPPTRGGRQRTGGSSEQGGQPSGSRTMSVAERMQSRLMDKMTSSSSDSARRVHERRSRSRSPRREVSRERRTSSSRRRRGSSPGERGRRRSRERKRSRSRSRSPPRRRSSRSPSRTSHSRDSSLSSSSSTTSEDFETVSVESAFVECGEEESSQLRRMLVFINHVADKLKTTLKVVSVPQRDNSTAVRVQLGCVSPLLISGSDKQDSGISLAVRNALYKMFDSVCSVGEVSFAMRQKVMNSNDVAAALGVALQPLFSYLNKSSIKDLEKRLRRCKAAEQGKLMKEFHQLSRTNALEFWKEHKDLVAAAAMGKMPSPPPLRVPSPVVFSAMAPAEKPLGTSISSGPMALDFIPLPATEEDEEDTDQPFHGAIKQATAPKIQIIAPLALPRTKSPSIHVNPNWLARRTGPETPPVTGVYEQTFGSSLEWPHELFEKAGNALLTTGNETDTAVVAVKKAGTERADSGPVAGTSRLGSVTEAVFQKSSQDSGREPARPAGQVPPGSIWNLFGPNGNWKDKSAAQAEKRDNSREKLH